MKLSWMACAAMLSFICGFAVLLPKKIAASRRSLLAALIAPILPGVAAAGPFVYTNVVDTSGPFAYFGTPAINNAGNVAFQAGLDAGPAGFFVGGGGSITPIVTFTNFSRPFGDTDINDAGTVAFSSMLDSGASGVFVGSGGPITPIAGDAPPLNSAGFPSINNAGAVAFQAGLAAGGSGMFINSGGTLSTVADTAGGFTRFFRGPSLNNRGMAAFLAILDSGDGGIFVGAGGATMPIADTGTTGSFAFLNEPSINDIGTVAFTGTLKTGANGIFVSNGGPPITIADDSGAFRSFNDNATPAINNAGAVAFFAFLDNRQYGLFLGPDPVRDRVIAVGDALFGSTVTSLGGLQATLNDAGEVAFLYTLADGRTGIARAGVAPEPDTLVLMAGALALLITMSRRRHLRRQ